MESQIKLAEPYDMFRDGFDIHLTFLVSEWVPHTMQELRVNLGKLICKWHISATLNKNVFDSPVNSSRSMSVLCKEVCKLCKANERQQQNS